MPDQQMFAAVDLGSGWETRPNRKGVRQKVLAESIDAGSKSGHCTRLVEFAPKVNAPASVHDYWEEIYLITGDLCLIDEKGNKITKFDAPAFVCRPATSATAGRHPFQGPTVGGSVAPGFEKGTPFGFRDIV